VYIFDAQYLYDQLLDDAERADSCHDFGKNIIPRLVNSGTEVYAHDFHGSCVNMTNGKPYWRDVGTIDAYWAANLDLASTIPALDLYDRNWPIWTHQEQLPPAKFVRDLNGLQGSGTNLIVCGGCVISGSQISRSVLSSNVVVNSFCNIAEAVLLPQVSIGASCRLRKVVIDRGCQIPDGTVIGEDPVRDGERFYRTDSGVVLVTAEALKRQSAR